MIAMTAPIPQKRGRRIAMTDAERDDFLGSERTCRVASVGPDGPHATPLWFVWRDGRGAPDMGYDERHAWLMVTPARS